VFFHDWEVPMNHNGTKVKDDDPVASVEPRLRR
jgi:hypothetical protein